LKFGGKSKMHTEIDCDRDWHDGFIFSLSVVPLLDISVGVARGGKEEREDDVSRWGERKCPTITICTRESAKVGALKGGAQLSKKKEECQPGGGLGRELLPPKGKE